MLYRIFTENNPEYKKRALNITAAVFPGFTVIDAEGYWEGESEKSLLIEIVAHQNKYSTVLNVAKAIKAANRQQAVLVQTVQNENLFV